MPRLVQNTLLKWFFNKGIFAWMLNYLRHQNPYGFRECSYLNSGIQYRAYFLLGPSTWLQGCGSFHVGL